MDRRNILKSALAAPFLASLPTLASSKPSAQSHDTYERDEIVSAASDFLGVTAEAIGGAIERIFMDYGDRPTAYIAGEEASGAMGVGVRYGKGSLYSKSQDNPVRLFWQGPSVGFDGGGNASRVFTLAYNLHDLEQIYRRFPGVEGTAYYIGGLGVNYQRAEGIVLTPIRAGIGLRLGANIGYLSYSRKRRFIPL